MNTGSPDEQARALRRMLPALGFETRRAFAAALHIDPSRVSRWMRAENQEVMGGQSRLALAALVGSRFWTVKAVTSFLVDMGWGFTEGEWQEARANLRRDLSLTLDTPHPAAHLPPRAQSTRVQAGAKQHGRREKVRRRRG